MVGKERTVNGLAQGRQDRGLHMDRVQSKLDRLLVAVANKLEREQSPRAPNVPNPARTVLLLNVKLARSTYRTICYLCADVRLNEHDWKWNYILCLPALNRTILDSVFTATFMLEDVEARSRWYHEAGFREARLELERYKKKYGRLPEWEGWLLSYAQMLEAGIKQFGISPEALKIKGSWWPNPGKMPSRASKPETRDFLQYLNDWFYREMSSQAHLGFLSATKLGFLIAHDTLDRDKREQIESKGFPWFRAHQVVRTVTLLLCLISEIEHHFGFELEHRVVELWQIVSEPSPEPNEVYQKRYSDFWPYDLVGQRAGSPS